MTPTLADDTTIEDALEQHDDPGHPDALSVDDVRELLAHVQHDTEAVWDQWMDNVERGETQVVALDGDVVVFDTGEHDTVRVALEAYGGDIEVDDIAERVVSTIHHRLAEEVAPDYSWGTTYPRVARLPADAEAGQAFAESVVNSLMGHGLSPGQAWAVYGVEVRGHSRNQWAKRCGYTDHSAVSEPLRKAESKAGHLGVFNS